jgi:hypothetical protein
LKFRIGPKAGQIACSSNVTLSLWDYRILKGSSSIRLPAVCCDFQWHDDGNGISASQRDSPILCSFETLSDNLKETESIQFPSIISGLYKSSYGEKQWFALDPSDSHKYYEFSVSAQDSHISCHKSRFPIAAVASSFQASFLWSCDGSILKKTQDHSTFVHLNTGSREISKQESSKLFRLVHLDKMEGQQIGIFECTLTKLHCKLAFALKLISGLLELEILSTSYGIPHSLAVALKKVFRKGQ